MRLWFWLLMVDLVLAWEFSRFSPLLPERVYSFVLGRAGDLTYGADVERHTYQDGNTQFDGEAPF